MKTEYYYMIMGALLFILGYAIANVIFNLPDKQTLTSESNNCNNLSLFMTADCLNNQVNEFFNYNISNVNKDLNLSELKEMGGVCRHYAEYYYDNIDTSRFYRKKVTMDLDNETAHMITLISNKEGYCTLDQSTYDCVKLRSLNEKE